MPLERIAVLKPRRRSSLQDAGDFGERLELEVERHQPLAESGRVEPEALEREIERVRGDRMEIRVAALQAPEPGVLELLLPPERRQGDALRRGHVGRAGGGGREVEQGAVGVEHAGADAVEAFGRVFGHAFLLCVQPPKRRPGQARRAASWIRLFRRSISFSNASRSTWP